MTDWQQIASQLAIALRSSGGCRCQLQRDKRGVPVWAGVPLERVQISKCGMHVALEAYEKAVKEEGAETELVFAGGAIKLIEEPACP